MRHTGSLAKVLERSAGSALALDEQRSLAGWRADGQLIEGQDLSALGEDSATSGFSDAQSAYLQLRDVEDASIVGDGSDNDGDGVLRGALLHETGQTLQRNRGLVGAAHKQTTQDDLVELLVRATVQESVELEMDWNRRLVSKRHYFKNTRRSMSEDWESLEELHTNNNTRISVCKHNQTS